MSFDRPEFSIDKIRDICDAPVGDADKDENGNYIPVSGGKCGGEIEWETERVQAGFVQEVGVCKDCGAYYTTEPHG